MWYSLMSMCGYHCSWIHFWFLKMFFLHFFSKGNSKSYAAVLVLQSRAECRQALTLLPSHQLLLFTLQPTSQVCTDTSRSFILPFSKQNANAQLISECRDMDRDWRSLTLGNGSANFASLPVTLSTGRFRSGGAHLWSRAVPPVSMLVLEAY